MPIHRWRSLVVLVVGSLALLEGVCPAEQGPEEQMPFSQGTEQPTPSVAEIDAAIDALDDPMDHEQMSWLFNAIAQQEDDAMRQQLFEKLDTRTTGLLESSVELPAASEDGQQVVVDPGLLEQAQQSGDVEMLRLAINTLHLGPDATVDELRRRDELVAKIAQIPDPDTRYELLELLEEHERNTQQVSGDPQGDSFPSGDSGLSEH